MPWTGVASFPTNAFSGRKFKGNNVLTLLAAARRGGFTRHLWASPKQWEANDGWIKEDAAGAIILVPQFNEEKKKAWTRNTPGISDKLGPIGGDAEGGNMSDFLGFTKERWYNIEETGGVVLSEPSKPTPSEAAKEMETALLAWFMPRGRGPALMSGGIRAAWYPALDRITSPPKAAYQARNMGGQVVGAYEFYVQTLGHEGVHATGSKGRLARNMKGGKQSAAYAKEELIAEMGTAFLCMHFGLPPQLLDHSTAYVASWLAEIGNRNRQRSFFWAVSQAEAAARYIIDNDRRAAIERQRAQSGRR